MTTEIEARQAQFNANAVDALEKYAIEANAAKPLALIRAEFREFVTPDKVAWLIRQLRERETRIASLTADLATARAAVGEAETRAKDLGDAIGRALEYAHQARQHVGLHTGRGAAIKYIGRTLDVLEGTLMVRESVSVTPGSADAPKTATDEG